MVLALLRTPDAEVLQGLSAALTGLAPHSWAAALVGGSVRATGGGAAPTAAELDGLAGQVSPGTPWYGRAVLGGTARQVLAVVSADQAAAGSVLVLADPPDDAAVHDAVQRLWEVAAARLKTLVSLGPVDPPLYLAAGRAAAGENAKAMTALKDAHAATLTTVLAALRSRRLDDAAARQAATDLASSALSELRAAPAGRATTASAAFASLGRRLRSLARHSGFDLELAPPRQAERMIAPEVAAAARAVVRGCVLATLEHTGPRRIRVGWEVAEADLRVTVRDDGDGALFPQALAEYRLRERLAALGGDFTMDAVPAGEQPSPPASRWPCRRRPAWRRCGPLAPASSTS